MRPTLTCAPNLRLEPKLKLLKDCPNCRAANDIGAASATGLFQEGFIPVCFACGENLWAELPGFQSFLKAAEITE